MSRYTLKYNKRISEVFDQPTWDVFEVHSTTAHTYANKWVVKQAEGYCLAYNDKGRTHLCDPMPSKELALQYIQALRIADVIEGNLIRFSTTKK